MMSSFSSFEKLVTTLGLPSILLAGASSSASGSGSTSGPGQQQQHALFHLAAVNGVDYQAALLLVVVVVVQDGGGGGGLRTVLASSVA